MGKIERFEDLQSWQKARKLANVIYDLTEKDFFQKIMNYEGKSSVPLALPCTISLKVLTRGQILSLFAF